MPRRPSIPPPEPSDPLPGQLPLEPEPAGPRRHAPADPAERERVARAALADEVADADADAAPPVSAAPLPDMEQVRTTRSLAHVLHAATLGGFLALRRVLPDLTVSAGDIHAGVAELAAELSPYLGGLSGRIVRALTLPAIAVKGVFGKRLAAPPPPAKAEDPVEKPTAKPAPAALEVVGGE